MGATHARFSPASHNSPIIIVTLLPTPTPSRPVCFLSRPKCPPPPAWSCGPGSDSQQQPTLVVFSCFSLSLYYVSFSKSALQDRHTHVHGGASDEKRTAESGHLCPLPPAPHKHPPHSNQPTIIKRRPLLSSSLSNRQQQQHKHKQTSLYFFLRTRCSIDEIKM